MSWLVFSCGSGVLLQWSQAGVNSVMRGHSHNSDVTRFDAHIAVDCAVPCVRPPRARFSITGKGNIATEKADHLMRLVGFPEVSCFRQPQHQRRLIQEVCCLSRQAPPEHSLSKWKSSWVFSPYESFMQHPRFCRSNNNLHQKNKSCQRVKNEASQIEIMTRVTRDTQNWKMLGKKKKNCLIWYRQIRFILQAEPGSNSSRHPAKDDMRPAGNWNLVAEPWCGVWLYSCQSQSGVDIFPLPRGHRPIWSNSCYCSVDANFPNIGMASR